jgi:RNA recognition motif-containing protein
MYAAQDHAVIAAVAERRRLYIKNLAYAANEDDLRELFQGYNVRSVSIPRHSRTDRPGGFRFVDVSTAMEAQLAIAELSGVRILGRKISVQLAHGPETPIENFEAAESGYESVSDGAGHYKGNSARDRGRGGRPGRGRRRESITRGTTHAELWEQAASLTDTPAEPIIQRNKQEETPSEADARAISPQSQEQKEPRLPNEPEDNIASKTKVMVSFSSDLNEETIQQLLTDFSPTTTRKTLRPAYLISVVSPPTSPLSSHLLSPALDLCSQRYFDNCWFVDWISFRLDWDARGPDFVCVTFRCHPQLTIKVWT